MTIVVPVQRASDYGVGPQVQSDGIADVAKPPETLGKAYCSWCHSTGHAWVQNRACGSVRIRCTCGATRIASGLADLGITTLGAGIFTVLMLGVMYLLGQPSPIF